jgi:hypothetical protein
VGLSEVNSGEWRVRLAAARGGHRFSISLLYVGEMGVVFASWHDSTPRLRWLAGGDVIVCTRVTDPRPGRASTSRTGLRASLRLQAHTRHVWGMYTSKGATVDDLKTPRTSFAVDGFSRERESASGCGCRMCVRGCVFVSGNWCG